MKVFGKTSLTPSVKVNAVDQQTLLCRVVSPCLPDDRPRVPVCITFVVRPHGVEKEDEVEGLKPLLLQEVGPRAAPCPSGRERSAVNHP